MWVDLNGTRLAGRRAAMQARVPSLFTLPIFAIACGSPAGPQLGEADQALSSRESSIIDAANQAAQDLMVAIDGSASAAVSTALVSAAARGVRSRGIIVETDHDATWTLQQRLESSGVDVDVRTESPAPGVLAVVDGTALVAQGSSVTRVTGDAAQQAAQAIDDALRTPVDAAPGTLIAAEQVRLLPMPESTDSRILELFATALVSIDLSIYQLEERHVISALTSAAARGVHVRVMLEPKTVGSQNFAAASRELEAAGVSVTTTPPVFDSRHNVDHAKFCILDGKELLFGTGNLVRSGLGGVTLGAYANRDFWIEDGRAASVTAAQALFDADLARRSTSGSDLSALVVTPDNADEAIGALIDGATTRLLVYNQTLVDPEIENRLVAAKQRGVDVHVLLGYQPPVAGASSPNDPAISTLTTAGITAQYLTGHYLHAKAIVADGRVYLGSQNFSSGGLRNNREVGEILSDPSLVSTVAETFARDEVHAP
jgi:phosphatidylserine/phosphatidylglycerophosphate/cardiolipin synthase-like enzyme